MARRLLVLTLLALGLLVPSVAQGATTIRPTVRSFAVAPTSVTEGVLPGIQLRIDQRGGRWVRARIVVLTQPRGDVAARMDLGIVRTGSAVQVPWPAGTHLGPGRYLVRLHALDPRGRTLLRRAHSSGRMLFTVDAAAPAPPVAPVAPVVVGGGVFPVAGPHVTAPAGGGGSFGAGRVGHIHEGHDIAAAQGTPVVAPVAGTVSVVRYQAGGAGWYVVLHGADGRDFFFAHCVAGSVVVAAAQPVAPGTPLCAVGMTGSATGPHLHFEIWPVGWRVPGGYPVDPLPQLLAWGG